MRMSYGVQMNDKAASIAITRLPNMNVNKPENKTNFQFKNQ